MNRLCRFGTVAVASVLSLAGAAQAQTAPSVNYIRFHAVQIVVTNAQVTSVSSGAALGNFASVAPGATITVEVDYVMNFSSNPADYADCPGCFIQNYLAWYPSAAAAGASPINIGFWRGSSVAPDAIFTGEGATAGHLVFTTTAPTVPGDYAIGVGETLDFGYVPTTTGAGGYDLSQGVPPGPGQFASFLINVANSPTMAPVACQGDANNDGSVNFDDITTVLGNFGSVCP
jgi:hypothetical protein